MWRQCVLFPDPKSGWEWAQDSVLGLQHVVRVLITLHRAGIRQVLLPAGSETLRPWLATVQQRRQDLPELIWLAQQAWPRSEADDACAGPARGAAVDARSAPLVARGAWRRGRWPSGVDAGR